jgi:hypothetical protein
MFEYFKNIEKLEEIDEIKKAYNFSEKIIKVLCSIGYHDIVNDEGVEICLWCGKENEELIYRKPNFLTNFLFSRHMNIAIELNEMTNPYRDY